MALQAFVWVTRRSLNRGREFCGLDLKNVAPLLGLPNPQNGEGNGTTFDIASVTQGG